MEEAIKAVIEVVVSVIANIMVGAVLEELSGLSKLIVISLPVKGGN